jgi:hypothetical protein
MNLERKEQQFIESREIKIINGKQLFDFGLKNLNEGLKTEIVPFLTEITKTILKVDELQIGGSAMEVMAGLIKPNEYWATKNQLKSLQNKIDSAKQNLDSGERLNSVLEALKVLGNGDADFDFYVDKKEKLKTIFTNIKYIYGGENVQISKNLKLDISYGPVGEGSLFYRTNFQLKDNQNNHLFHIDITTTPETGDDEAQNRRHNIGDIHDNCRGKMKLNDGQIEISISKEEIPKANYQSKMKLEDKDINSIYEVVMREMRKKIMHSTSVNNSQRNDFDLRKIFPLIDAESFFELRELNFNEDNKVNKLFERQTLSQKRMLYQELFLMAQTDPYSTIMFLQDTEMDVLFFGRHLTSEEVKGLLKSQYLDFLSDDKQKNWVEKVKDSREFYINLPDNNEKKNGAERFIKAVGQVLGKEINDYKIHFKKGLEILGDPENKVEKIFTLDLENKLEEKPREMFEQLKNGGGLTKKGLHSLLNKIDPEKYPNRNKKNKKEFDKEFLKLEKSGLIKTVTRIILVDKEKLEVKLYYPCTSETRIEKVLLDARVSDLESFLINSACKNIGVETMEAALSIRKKDLKKSENFSDKLMSIIQPYLILRLITHQEKIQGHKKTIDNIDDFKPRKNIK